MKKVLSFVLFAFVSAGVFAQSTWTVDKAHSQVSFGIVHSGISEIEGTFNAFDANIISSEEDFTDATFNVTIDVSSIDTGVERRDGHLKSADFFEVETYPEMTFKSTKIEEVGKGKFEVTGDLSFHGVTKPVTLEVWHRGTVASEKGETAGFRVTGTIKRSDFNFGSDFPAPMLSNEVTIEVDGQFKKQA